MHLDGFGGRGLYYVIFVIIVVIVMILVVLTIASEHAITVKAQVMGIIDKVCKAFLAILVQQGGSVVYALPSRKVVQSKTIHGLLHVPLHMPMWITPFFI